MPKYAVTYTIEGSIQFDAETAEEAERKLWHYSMRELADIGSLLVHTADKVEERAGVKRVLVDSDGSYVGVDGSAGADAVGMD